MSDEGKLLTDAELQAIAKQNNVVGITEAGVERLLADLLRYRGWCKRLVRLCENWDSYDGTSSFWKVPEIAAEVKAALTENSSA